MSTSHGVDKANLRERHGTQSVDRQASAVEITSWSDDYVNGHHGQKEKRTFGRTSNGTGKSYLFSRRLELWRLMPVLKHWLNVRGLRRIFSIHCTTDT
jgi:hypothetical protein